MKMSTMVSAIIILLITPAAGFVAITPFGSRLVTTGTSATTSLFQVTSHDHDIIMVKKEEDHDDGLLLLLEPNSRREMLTQAFVKVATTGVVFAGTMGGAGRWSSSSSSSSLLLGDFVRPAPVYAATTTTAVLDYKAVSADIAKLIKKNPDWGPTMVRLAWHSSGTYDKMTKTGGSGGGTIRFPQELARGANAGLAKTAVNWLEPIHKKYASKGLSYADLYTLAGVTAIKEMGGPIIGWSSGRLDQPITVMPPDGRLPNADSGPPLADQQDANHLRTIFNRMGFNDQEIVALSGAHALGRCHETASGYSGPWTPTPTTFNNAYFTLLKNLNWIPKQWKGPPQYVDAPTGRLMMLPTDLVLLQDKSFMKWVNVYAQDGTKFNKDFSRVFQKLEELGTSGLKPTEWA